MKKKRQSLVNMMGNAVIAVDDKLTYIARRLKRLENVVKNLKRRKECKIK